MFEEVVGGKNAENNEHGTRVSVIRPLQLCVQYNMRVKLRAVTYDNIIQTQHAYINIMQFAGDDDFKRAIHSAADRYIIQLHARCISENVTKCLADTPLCTIFTYTVTCIHIIRILLYQFYVALRREFLTTMFRTIYVCRCISPILLPSGLGSSRFQQMPVSFEKSLGHSK